MLTSKPTSMHLGVRDRIEAFRHGAIVARLRREVNAARLDCATAGARLDCATAGARLDRATTGETAATLPRQRRHRPLSSFARLKPGLMW